MEQTLSEIDVVKAVERQLRKGARPLFTDDLPPPLTKRINLKDDQVAPDMSAKERAWVLEVVGKTRIVGVFLTRTRVDVGHWLTRGRIWALAAREELILVASGKHPFVERVAYSRLRASLYNHLTGELVLAPAETLTAKKLGVRPLEGLQLLAQVFREGKKNA